MRSQLESRWKIFLAELRTAVLLLDADANIAYANAAAAELLRHDTEDLVGKNARTFIAADTPGYSLRLDTIGGATSSTEARFPSRVTVVARDGSTYDVDLTVTRLPESDSSIFAVQMRKSREEEVDGHPPAKLLDDNAHRSRDEILGTICHELRTPLHGLIATLDILRDEQLSETGSQQLALAKASARTILTLVTDMLDIARIARGGHFPLKQAPFSLEALLQEAVAQYSAKAAAKGLDLWLIVSAHRPSYFLGDRQRVKQIVSNLLTNAIKFATAGYVLVHASYVDGAVQIDVHDSGVGIPADMREAIFQPFVQTNPQHARHGTGLGLPIGRRLSQAMGGQLDLVESGPAGSTFRITLPLPRSDRLPVLERHPADFTAPRGHVLVVDDHPTNLFVVRTMLESLKCSCALASSGQQALELMEAQSFDLILMDCRMPDMDGLETTRRARRLLNEYVPIVAMTADSSVKQKKAARAAGMDDYLIKPFDRLDLSRILRAWLNPNNATTGFSESPTYPVVDQAVLTELWESVNWQAEPLRNIAKGFKETIAFCLSAFERSDAEEIRRHLHTVIGTGGMIGAMEIRSLATQLQEAFKSGDAEQVHELKAKLFQASDRFERAIAESLECLD